MNQDGWGFTGAGVNDRKLVGPDLQHSVQDSTNSKYVSFKPIVGFHEDGGPMKEKINTMHEQLEVEKKRHEESLKHHEHHLEKHRGRHYDSQYGQDDYKY